MNRSSFYTESGLFNEATLAQLETVLSMLDDMEDSDIEFWHIWAFNKDVFLSGNQAAIDYQLKKTIEKRLRGQ